jgi:hypothetical protein
MFGVCGRRLVNYVTPTSAAVPSRQAKGGPRHKSDYNGMPQRDQEQFSINATFCPGSNHPIIMFDTYLPQQGFMETVGICPK